MGASFTTWDRLLSNKDDDGWMDWCDLKPNQFNRHCRWPSVSQSSSLVAVVLYNIVPREIMIINGFHGINHISQTGCGGWVWGEKLFTIGSHRFDRWTVSVAPNESDSMCFCQSSSSAHTKFVITIMPQIAKFITFYQVSDDKIAGCTVVIV